MRKVLVLGGTGDIGSAIVNQFSNDFILSVGKAGVDLSDKESVNKFINLHGSEFDTIIHSAGYNVPKDFKNLGMEELNKSLQSNLLGFLPIVQNNIEYWKSSGTGRIVVIGSLYGFLSRKGRLPYAISKHGLGGLVKTLAIELGPIGVTVNSVSPGFINTKMTNKNNSSETIKKLVGGVPVGRLGTPEEVARVVAFLGDEQNTYINGQDIVIDGGYSIGGFQ